MTQGLAALNEATPAEARAALARCCGAARWVEAMLAQRPFADGEALLAAAGEVWARMERRDLLEAFSHHPQIGADLTVLRQRFAATETWSAEEQGGVARATEETLQRLADGNLAYQARFGFIFIVCASGKSAEEMLGLLEGRLGHGEDEELAVAGREQAAIMRLRLQKLIRE